LGDGVFIQLINTLDCCVAKSFLEIRKQQTSEILSLEKVFALVLLFGLSQYVGVLPIGVHFWLNEFESQTIFRLARVDWFNGLPTFFGQTLSVV
jgi:hypothetical protein